jgi:hypothetical protein
MGRDPASETTREDKASEGSYQMNKRQLLVIPALAAAGCGGPIPRSTTTPEQVKQQITKHQRETTKALHRVDIGKAYAQATRPREMRPER